MHDARAAVMRANALLAYAAAAAILVGVTFDTFGLASGRTVLWVIGAHAIAAGVVLGFTAALASWIAHRVLRQGPVRRTPAPRRILILTAVILLALARWVRGHPEVRPDPPIFGAEMVAAVVLLAAVVRGRLPARLHP